MSNNQSSLVVQSQPTKAVATIETASTAASVQARAQVEARYLMALQQPRSLMAVRARLLDRCQSPKFAETARYSKPVGKKPIVGWSIRFAEECARQLGNLLIESSVTFDDAETRVIRVMVTDLESNLSYPTEISIPKTVERSFLKDGQTAIKQRTNSQGRITYLVEATEDDFLNKQNALVSKAIRNSVIRLVPGDFLEEAEEVIAETVRRGDSEDPSRTAKKIADAFYSHGIDPTQIEKVLGHSLTKVSAAEVTLMRAWFVAIKDGETTWSEIVEQQTGGEKKKDAPKTSAKGTDGLLARVKATTTPAETPTTEKNVFETVPADDPSEDF